jgi:hypothetical protein
MTSCSSMPVLSLLLLPHRPGCRSSDHRLQLQHRPRRLQVAARLTRRRAIAARKTSTSRACVDPTAHTVADVARRRATEEQASADDSGISAGGGQTLRVSRPRPQVARGYPAGRGYGRRPTGRATVRQAGDQCHRSHHARRRAELPPPIRRPVRPEPGPGPRQRGPCPELGVGPARTPWLPVGRRVDRPPMWSGNRGGLSS